MDRDLIEMDIKEAIEKVVDTLENHNSSVWRPEGSLDSRIYDIVQDHITSTLHSIADDLNYKFKLGDYANISDNNTD